MEEKKIFTGFAIVSFVLLLVAVSGIGDRPGNEPAEVTESEEADVSEVEEVTETEVAEEESAEEAAPEANDTQEATAETVAETDTNPEKSETAEAPNDDLRSAGETALFADGAVRVFVSRIDADAQEARLTVNGETVTLGAGATTMASANGVDCSLVMNAVTSAGVDLSAICGDDLPEPAGITVGETETLMDGKLRVFASRIDDGSARVAINGELTTLAVGSAARADLGEERCHITLASVERGHADVSADCGAMPPRSELVGPGETAVLTAGENTARVFVSAVDDRRDQARVAVNGFGMTTSEKGASIDLDNGCEIVVENVSKGQASFSLGCAD